MAEVRPDVERMWAIIKRLEDMYREWNELEQREWRRAIVPSAAFPAMFDRHHEMVAGFDDDALKARLAANADLLEAYAVLAFNRAAQNLGDAAPADDVEDQPLRGVAESRALGGRGNARRRGLHGGRGSRVAGGRDGKPVHGGDRDPRVTRGHAPPQRGRDCPVALL